MSISSAVASLSRYPEAFGHCVNEALSLEIPIAGYDHGGVGEQLAGHFPAGLVPPGNRDVMTERLAGWVAAPPSMANVQPYTLDDMLQQTLELYHQLAASGR